MSTKPLSRVALEWAKSLIVALGIWFLLSTFVVQAFRIPSASMENTLLVGDFLFVAKPLYGARIPFTHTHLPAFREPRRGELIVFDSPIEDLRVVKRLIGLPGDTLSMRDGALSRNGQALDEPYVQHRGMPGGIDSETRSRMVSWQLPYLVGVDKSAYRPDPNNWGPIVVPPGHIFLLGDNRDESFDGRFYGFVPRPNVLGKPILVYFSYDPSSWRALPIVTAVRWRRLFTVPR